MEQNVICGHKITVLNMDNYQFYLFLQRFEYFTLLSTVLKSLRLHQQATTEISELTQYPKCNSLKYCNPKRTYHNLQVL